MLESRKEALPEIKHELFVPAAFVVVGQRFVTVVRSAIAIGVVGDAAAFEASRRQRGHEGADGCESSNDSGAGSQK